MVATEIENICSLLCYTAFEHGYVVYFKDVPPFLSLE